MEFYNNHCHNNKMNYEINERNSYNDYQDDSKTKCCVRRTEETFYCYPSYYNEEKENCKKEEKRPDYYEGTFKFWPSYCDSKKDNYRKDDDCKCYKKHQECDNNHKDYDNCAEEKQTTKCRKRCCFCCGLFGRRW